MKMNNGNILKNFEKASVALVEAFAKKQDLDFDFFIGDNPAEAISFSCEITFNLNEIYHDLATNQPKGLIMEWFYENLEQYHKGNNDYINYYSWTMGKRYEDKEPSNQSFIFLDFFNHLIFLIIQSFNHLIFTL